MEKEEPFPFQDSVMKNTINDQFTEHKRNLDKS